MGVVIPETIDTSVKVPETIDVLEEDIPEVSKEMLIMLVDSGFTIDDGLVVNFVKTKHIATPIILDIGDRLLMETEAVVDTGSPVSFISTEVLEKMAPQVLGQLEPCPITFRGVGGSSLKANGIKVFNCEIGGKVLSQLFVIAPIIEPVILGLDFMEANKATFDWNRGIPKLKYQDDGLREETGLPICRVITEVELIPGAVTSVRVSLNGWNKHMEQATFLACRNSRLPADISVTDMLVRVEDGEADLLVYSFSQQIECLEQGETIGTWDELIETSVFSIQEFSSLKSAEVVAQVSVQEKGELNIELPKELQELFERCSVGLTKEQGSSLKELLWDYRHIFKFKGQPNGKTAWEVHQIDLLSPTPIKERVRQIPIHKSEEVENEIQQMLQNGVIRESNSPWSAPVVIVRKKDGSCRFCIDYRKLNAVTVKDAYPLPCIEENLDTLAGSSWFSSLDLAAGYWQVAVAEEDKSKTAFACKFGHFEFNVMPFGLSNAPSTFQRLMEKVLSGYQWKILVLYLDDVVVFATEFEEHLKRLRQVFQRFSNAGLKLKPKKCDLLKRQVKFLGHVVDEAGIHTDPEKIEKVSNWATPKSEHDVRIFLGLTSYYRRFVESYAKIASPLHELTRKNVEFEWTAARDNAFQTLKSILSKELELSYPSKSGEYVLDTDACDVAIGAALHQIQDGKEKLLRFGSRCLTKEERNYCVTRKEFLAVVYFMDYFHHYLWGAKLVTVRTDHGSLQWLKSMSNPSGQVARWIQKLEIFNWKIEYRPGKQHNNADALSRRPCEGDCSQCLKMLSYLPEAEPPVVRRVVVEKPIKFKNRHARRKHVDRHRWENLPMDWDIAKLIAATAADPYFSKLLSWDIRPPFEEVSNSSAELKFYRLAFSCWYQDNRGLLWYKHETQDGQEKLKLMIPKSYRYKVMSLMHDAPQAGHFGVARTVQMLMNCPVFWHGMRQDMRKYCQTCDSCLRCKKSGRPKRSKMVTFISGEPLQRMALDVAGPFHTSSQGNKYILVVIDYFTKYCFMIPLPDHQAETLANVLVMKVFSRVGIPEHLHSDQGSDFMSQVFSETCRMFHVEKTRTTPWHPQSDGLCERMNRTIGAMLRQYVNGSQTDWDTHLPLCELAYNSTVQKSTRFTPNMLMFGREFRLPLELVLPKPEGGVVENNSVNVSTFVQDLTRTLNGVYELTRLHLEEATALQKSYHDRKTTSRKFKTGDSVWLYNPKRKKGRTPKLDKAWEGPYAVIETKGPVLVKIQQSIRSKFRVVHIDKLILTNENFDTTWVFRLPKKHFKEVSQNVLPDLRHLYTAKPGTVVTFPAAKTDLPKKTTKIVDKNTNLDTNLTSTSVLEKSIMEPPNTVVHNRKNDVPKRGIEQVDLPETISKETLAKPDQMVTRSGKVYRNMNNDRNKSKRQYIKPGQKVTRSGHVYNVNAVNNPFSRNMCQELLRPGQRLYRSNHMKDMHLRVNDNTRQKMKIISANRCLQHGKDAWLVSLEV